MKSFTSCENCVFNVKKNGQQVGCFAKDISHIDYIVDSNGNFKLNNRLCNFKREGNVKATNLEEKLQKVRKQVTLNYAVFSLFDSIPKAIAGYDNLLKCSVAPAKFYAYIPSKVFTQTLSEYKDIVQEKTADGKLELCIVEDPDMELVRSMGMQYKGYSHHVFLEGNLSADIYSSFFEWLDIQINDNDFRFKVITGDCVVIPEILYYTTNINVKSILEMASKDKDCYDFRNLYDQYLNFSSWDPKQKRFV